MNFRNDEFSRKSSTGIIFFSRTRNCEARSKKWHPSHSKNLEIAHHLIESTKSVLHSTGHDVIIIDETKQHGDSFGEKIQSAFLDTFELGYTQLILVGNDSVGLSEAYISDSIHFLQENDCVFGSTRENGLYLIGFERSFFLEKSEQIAGLPWRSKYLSRAFSELANFEGKSILPILSDLNTIEDIRHLLKNRFDVFTEVIRKITHGCLELFDRELFSVIRIYEFNKVKKRGPPSACVS